VCRVLWLLAVSQSRYTMNGTIASFAIREKSQYHSRFTKLAITHHSMYYENTIQRHLRSHHVQRL
jgi:hypothetical protein